MCVCVREHNDVAAGNQADGRREGVLVNGVKRNIDLVALICYSKLKKKCPGKSFLRSSLVPRRRGCAPGNEDEATYVASHPFISTCTF